MVTFCHNCGAKAVDDKSLFCNNCGSQLIRNIPKTNDTKYVREAERSNEDYFLPATDSVIRSQKSKSQKPLKRRLMVLPAVLFFIAFVLIIWILSQSGVSDFLFSIGPTNASQGDIIAPAIVTQTLTPRVTTVAPMIKNSMMNTPMTPTLTPIPTQTVLTTESKGAPTTQSATKNIFETAEADGQFTTFVAAVKAAGLNDTLTGDTLSGPQMFTVFAPTDDAFKNLTGSVDTLLNDPQGALLQILLYHMVNGKVTTVDLEKLSSVETVQGGPLPISVSSGTISVDGAKVIFTDIECSNGMIHAVDTVMLPPA